MAWWAGAVSGEDTRRRDPGWCKYTCPLWTRGSTSTHCRSSFEAVNIFIDQGILQLVHFATVIKFSIHEVWWGTRIPNRYVVFSTIELGPRTRKDNGFFASVRVVARRLTTYNVPTTFQCLSLTPKVSAWATCPTIFFLKCCQSKIWRSK